MVEGWECRELVITRIAQLRLSSASLENLVLVTHGLLLTIWLDHEVELDDPFSFWSNLRMPDAWELSREGSHSSGWRSTRLSTGRTVIVHQASCPKGLAIGLRLSRGPVEAHTSIAQGPIPPDSSYRLIGRSALAQPSTALGPHLQDPRTRPQRSDLVSWPKSGPSNRVPPPCSGP
jgi:hypothetical protein